MRIVLAEDELLLREGMASLLERSGFEVVGQAGDAVQLLAAVGDTSPDLVVVDIRMPPTRTREGLEAAREIRQQHPDIGILVLSAHVEVEHAVELLASGRGIGYLSTQEPRDRRNGIRRHARTHREGGLSRRPRAGARARLCSPAH